MPDIFGTKSGTLLQSLTPSSNDTLEASELMKLGDCLVSSWSITKPFFHYAMLFLLALLLFFVGDDEDGKLLSYSRRVQ